MAVALMAHRRRILILDSTGSPPELADTLGKEAVEARTVRSLAQAREALGNSRFDVLIANLESCESLSSDVIRDLRRDHPEIPVIFVIETGSVPAILAAIRAGVVDCLIRPFEPEDLRAVLDRAFEFGKVSRAIEGAESPSDIPEALDGVVATSPSSAD